MRVKVRECVFYCRRNVGQKQGHQARGIPGQATHQQPGDHAQGNVVEPASVGSGGLLPGGGGDNNHHSGQTEMQLARRSIQQGAGGEAPTAGFLAPNRYALPSDNVPSGHQQM